MRALRTTGFLAFLPILTAPAFAAATPPPQGTCSPPQLDGDKLGLFKGIGTIRFQFTANSNWQAVGSVSVP